MHKRLIKAGRKLRHWDDVREVCALALLAGWQDSGLGELRFVSLERLRWLSRHNVGV